MGELILRNMFLVTKYWMDKFHNVTDIPVIPTTTMPPYTDLANVTLIDSFESLHEGEKLTNMQMTWNSYLAVASMIPNVLFLKLNAIFGHKFPMQPRLIVAIISVIVIFCFTAAMTQVNTDPWQSAFLIGTLCSVVVINVMVAIFQGGLTSVAGQFPPKYMGSVVQGQALGGIFAAGTNVICLALGADATYAAFCCFIVTVVFLTTALVAYIFVNRTEFFKYYFENRHCTDNQEERKDDNLGPEGDRLIPGSEETVQIRLPEKINVTQIAKQIWVWIAAVFLTFVVTLACFPAVTALVQSESSNAAWANTYFLPVGCFLVFNIGDFAGRILQSVVQLPRATVTGGWVVLAMATARLSFLPLFLLCNASPKNRYYTSVVFESDTAYLILMVLFSVSSGYIGSACMMFAPKMLPPGQSQATAASIMVSFLVLGLAVGAALSNLAILLL